VAQVLQNLKILICMALGISNEGCYSRIHKLNVGVLALEKLAINALGML